MTIHAAQQLRFCRTTRRHTKTDGFNIEPTVKGGRVEGARERPKVSTAGVGGGVGVGSGPDGDWMNPGPCNDPLQFWLDW